MTFYKMWASSLMPAQDFQKFLHESGKLCRGKEMKMTLEGMIRHELYPDLDVQQQQVPEVENADQDVPMDEDNVAPADPFDDEDWDAVPMDLTQARENVFKFRMF
jgi:hypothetical protein